MKTRLLVILILLFIVSFSYAQYETDSLKIFKTNSLQFRVYDFISLSSFKGTIFSYKYHTSDCNAFRIGVSARVKKSEEDNAEDILYYDTTMYDLNQDNKSIGLEIIAQYLKYFNPQDDIKLFLGFGPRILISLSTMDNNSIDIKQISNTFSYYKKYKYEYYQIGITAGLGLEWFFRKNMSLHAEYGFNAYYFVTESIRNLTYVDPDYTNAQRNKSTKETGFELVDTGALLGLSIYF